MPLFSTRYCVLITKRQVLAQTQYSYLQDDEIAELKSKMDDMAEEFGEMLRVSKFLSIMILFCTYIDLFLI